MSMERVIKALENLGLSRTDAELYVYISRNGPQTETDLKYSYKMKNEKLKFCLKKLYKKGLIEKSSDQPALFFSVGFKKAFELLINFNMKKAQKVIHNKDKLLHNCNNIDYKKKSQKQ